MKKHASMDGKPPDEQYFAGLRELKNIVRFYFMPVYTVPELGEQVPASLQRILKGNACFNVKALTPEMIADLHAMMKSGVVCYEKRAWM